MSNFACLAGVLKGPGYLYRGQSRNPRFQVETKSKNFAEKIVRALIARGFVPSIARSGHKRTRIHPNKTYHYDYLPYLARVTLPLSTADAPKNFRPNTLNEKRSFVTGFFESEGTARRQVYHGRVCYRIVIYNRELSRLHKIQRLVSELGLDMRLRNCHSRIPLLESGDRAGFNKFVATLGGKP